MCDKLGELHKKEQLNVDVTLQIPLATSNLDIQTQEQAGEEKDEAEEHSNVHMVTIDTVPHEGEKDKDVPKWLNFTFEKKKKVVLPKFTFQ